MASRLVRHVQSAGRISGHLSSFYKSGPRLKTVGFSGKAGSQGATEFSFCGQWTIRILERVRDLVRSGNESWLSMAQILNLQSNTLRFKSMKAGFQAASHTRVEDGKCRANRIAHFQMDAVRIRTLSETQTQRPVQARQNGRGFLGRAVALCNVSSTV